MLPGEEKSTRDPASSAPQAAAAAAACALPSDCGITATVFLFCAKHLAALNSPAKAPSLKIVFPRASALCFFTSAGARTSRLTLHSACTVTPCQRRQPGKRRAYLPTVHCSPTAQPAETDAPSSSTVSLHMMLWVISALSALTRCQSTLAPIWESVMRQSLPITV